MRKKERVNKTGKAQVSEIAEKLADAGSTVEERRFKRRVSHLESFGLQPWWLLFAAALRL